MRIVFFGTPPFAADVLNQLINNGVEVAAVVSRPDKPQGRSLKPIPGAVRVVAEAHQIPHFQPEKVSSLEFIPVLEAFYADLFVVVAYGEILSQKVLDLPKIACLNVHASLLPKYRGAAPIQRAIINGEAETGVTIMHMVKKMDAGDIILQAALPITLETTYGSLEFAMRELGSKALLEVIDDLEKGASTRKVQDEMQVTFAPKIELEDCKINWDLSALEIHHLIRGVNPEPGAWCRLIVQGEEKRLKVWNAVPRQDISSPFRKFTLDPSKNVLIGCGKGSLQLEEVQLEGKKKMPAADFYRGLSNKILEIC